MNPPEYIENAKVLLWAKSEEKPFGLIENPDGTVAAEVFGLAICQDKNDSKIYRMSCNKKWEPEQDSHYDSIEQAIESIPAQYKSQEISWKSL